MYYNVVLKGVHIMAVKKDKELFINFGSRLKQLRIDKGLGFEELADDMRAKGIEITSGYIRQLEAGRNLPSSQLLYEMSKYLGVSMDYFFSYQNNAANRKQTLDNIAIILSTVDDDNLKKIEESIKKTVSLFC